MKATLALLLCVLFSAAAFAQVTAEQATGNQTATEVSICRTYPQLKGCQSNFVLPDPPSAGSAIACADSSCSKWEWASADRAVCKKGQHVVLAYTEDGREQSLCSYPSKCSNGRVYGDVGCVCNDSRPVLNDKGEVTGCLSPLATPDGPNVEPTYTLVPVEHYVPKCPDGYELWAKNDCSQTTAAVSSGMMTITSSTGSASFGYDLYDAKVDGGEFGPGDKPTNFVCKPKGSSTSITHCSFSH